MRELGLKNIQKYISGLNKLSRSRAPVCGSSNSRLATVRMRDMTSNSIVLIHWEDSRKSLVEEILRDFCRYERL